MTEKKLQKREAPEGFRPTDEAKKLIEWAQRQTGSSKSRLIDQCIVKVMREVVREEIERDLKEAQERKKNLLDQ